MCPRHPKCCTCHTESSSCPKSKMTTVSQDETFDPFKTSSKFTQYCACHAKWPPKTYLILTDACQRLSNVKKVPRLPHAWKRARRPVMHNDVLFRKGPKLPRLPRKRARHASKMTPSEKPRPRRSSCASLRSRNAHGHLKGICTRIYNERAGNQRAYPDLTLVLWLPP